MNKFLKGLLTLVIIALFIGVGTVEARDYAYWVRFVDLQGDEITADFKVCVMDNDTYTASTVYSDANRTALTNATLAGTSGTNGGIDPGTDAVLKWWGPSTSYSLYITDGEFFDHVDDITVTDHRITFVGRTIRLDDGTFDETEPGRIVVIAGSLDTYICTGTDSWVRIDD